ncbi:MAG: ribonuclease H [Miltoncostaeaceae bacterium]
MSEPTHTLVTDGACSGNGTDAARGGWAAILTAADGSETVLTGGEMPSTNNRMELTAVLEGLREAPEGAHIELVTDSSYVANAILKGWLEGWRKRGWRTAAKQPVANRDLWERYLVEAARHRRVAPVLVRGHAGHEANERADRLAQEAAALARPAPASGGRPGPAAEGAGGSRGGQLGLDL